MNHPPRDGRKPESASFALAKIVSEITQAHEAELEHAAAEHKAVADQLQRQLAAASAELARERDARKKDALRNSEKFSELSQIVAQTEGRLSESLRRAEALVTERNALAEQLRAMAATHDSERARLKKHAESIIHRIRTESEEQRKAAERSLREELSRQGEVSNLNREELRESFEREKAALLAAWKEERHSWLAREEKQRLEALELRARDQKEKSALEAMLQRDRQIAHRWAERDKQREAELQLWKHRLSTLESENGSSRAETQRLETLLRETKERAESLEHELERLRRIYPLRDLHAEKSEQIRKFRTSVSELPPDYPLEEKSRAERVLQLLEVQKTEIETALRNAEAGAEPGAGAGSGLSGQA